MFNSILTQYFNECYPVRTKRISLNKNKNPWITPGLMESIRTKNKLYKKYVKRPITFGDQYRLYRNTLTRLLKLAKDNHHKEKFLECQGNPKKMWQNINKILGKNHNNNEQIFKINNTDTTNTKVIADEFNDYFSSIAEDIGANLPPAESDFRTYLPDHEFENIEWTNTTICEIKQVLKRCNNTNGGPDGLPMSLLKNNADLLAPILCHLCNLSISTGIFPNIHKNGTIIPLYKNKDKNNIHNYRPICLLNVVGKILEKIISIRLIHHLETSRILSNSQFAYREGRGTESAILKFINDIISAFEKGEYTVAVFLDLTKAFDCVDHEILLQKLCHYGVNNVALQWFRSYLSARKQRVKFQGTLSEEKIINIGVPQGSILGPVLFFTYFQDICSVSNGKEILFADDATTYDSGKCYFQVIERLNAKLMAISQWLIANKLLANIIKTEGMVFSRRNIYFPLPPLQLYGKPIPFSFSFKFLGITIDPKLSWKYHFASIQSKLSRACGILYTIRNKIPRTVARLIYLTIAYPYLMYGNVIWSASYESSISKLISGQKRLIRIIMKRERTANSDPLFKRLNLLKLNEINKMCTALFVYKSLNNLIHSSINFTYRNVQRYDLRNNNIQLETPFVRFRFSQLFINTRGPNLWNSIPPNLRLAGTLFTFKRNMKKYYLDSYNGA